MAVLVTRPNEQGQALCQLLDAAGIPALHLPLLTMLPGKDFASIKQNLANIDIVIAVSQHAVSYTQQALNGEWPSNTIYIAVGQKTAHTLGKFSQQYVHYPDVADSEHLLKINQLKHVVGKKIVILRGNGGRELIHSTLLERGAQVSYLEAYKRENLTFDPDIEVLRWKNNHVTSVVITSLGQLNHFVSQLTQTKKEWVFKRQLFVPSQRIASHAQRLGFLDVINTGSASNKDLLAALKPR
ncbi:uroporphyrinogen-III synthase [Vibrio zhanjiangensis]|uniref:Uroporphyrinogen-III synthase n=1 Tax=Vibrio zhanjiangensis TaxID=1046128 RepID=A0ABQ6F0K4_9VIBR|nr:uroporphyrinogen-III synthase [Vibrio zhanjiangensis]GLT19013.1 uroporphyrinogen-III synthase [Vibrio zhanjiangensis]